MCGACTGCHTCEDALQTHPLASPPPQSQLSLNQLVIPPQGLNSSVNTLKGDVDAPRSSKDGRKVIYVRARDPFPMGRVRTPLARPDLDSLALFHGIQFDLKVRCPMVGYWSVIGRLVGKRW